MDSITSLPGLQGGAGVGLVSSAISSREQEFTLEVLPGGLIVRRPGACGGDNFNLDASKRGNVRGFSAKSRRRCVDRLMRVDWQGLASSKQAKQARAYFVTLTYPDIDLGGFDVWKGHLDVFLKRLERAFPVEGVFWKLEPQPQRTQESGRFVPHYHVLVAFSGPVDKRVFRRWLSQAWFEIVGSNDPKHLKAGTQAAVVWGKPGRLMAYLSKYIGKEFESTQEITGRVWGERGKLPDGQAQACVLTEAQAVEVMRRLRAWGKRSRYLRSVGRRNNLYYVTEGARAGPLGFIAFGVGAWILQGLDANLYQV